MKLISWNVNGIRACLGKGFIEFLNTESPDILCIQETKMQEGQAEVLAEGYHQYWNSAERKGYSGTAVFTKKEPLSVTYGIGVDCHDHEGRVITAEYGDFYLVNVYTPNSQHELKRLEYRMEWEEDFRQYLMQLDKTKPVILCGDLNVAHREIDLKNPKSNQKNPGFTPQERGKLDTLLGSGFIDTFRHFYPDLTGAYSWWSYRFNARKNNAGWRIDYFVVSQRLAPRLKDAAILANIMGSDHCPVTLDLA
jgi:exodeoxyribonuclease-3